MISVFGPSVSVVGPLLPLTLTPAPKPAWLKLTVLRVSSSEPCPSKLMPSAVGAIGSAAVLDGQVANAHVAAAGDRQYPAVAVVAAVHVEQGSDIGRRCIRREADGLWNLRTGDAIAPTLQRDVRLVVDGKVLVRIGVLARDVDDGAALADRVDRGLDVVGLAMRGIGADADMKREQAGLHGAGCECRARNQQIQCDRRQPAVQTKAQTMHRGIPHMSRTGSTTPLLEKFRHDPPRSRTRITPQDRIRQRKCGRVRNRIRMHRCRRPRL